MSLDVGVARWVFFFVVATAVAGASCGQPSGSAGASGGAGGQGRPAPTLVDAELVSPTELSLTFSQAMKPPNAADPTAFRLSAAVTVAKGSTYFQADYSGDVYGHYASLAACRTLCTSYCQCHHVVAEKDRTFYYDIGDVAGLAVGHGPTELVATLAAPLGAVSPPSPLGDAGPCGHLFLHYAEGAVAIEDQAGDHLASIAPTWAERPATSHLEVDGLLSRGPVPVGRSILDPYCAGHGCDDGLVDGDESDVDCGGRCASCGLGKHCNDSPDCDSDACVGGTCHPASCTDGIANEGEIGVDCGGATSCARCPDGTPRCGSGSDCSGGACLVAWVGPAATEDQCETSSCSDGVRDGDETDIDCGGSCGGCLGAPCVVATDCASRVCSGQSCVPPVVSSVTAGGCAVTSTGALACWGAAHTLLETPAPAAIPGLASAVLGVAVSGLTSCAIDGAGQVFCWGDNSTGQIGDGTKQWRPLPVQVTGLAAPVTAVTSSSGHTCALLQGGAMLCWGDNADGQIGDGTTTTRKTPVPVAGLGAGVVAITAATAHSCALTTSGGVKCWGDNSSGQLGDGTTTKRTAPVDVTGLTAGVVAISAGGDHTCALTTAGGLRCWGGNHSGELGIGTTTKSTTPLDVLGLTSGVAAVSAGAFHTCALTTGGGVLCWGDNSSGELGDGTTTQRERPTAVSSLASGVAAISANPDVAVSCALTTTGRALCWGDNEVGQVGYGSPGAPFAITSPTEVYGL